MDIINNIKNRAKANIKTIVLTETEDERILVAASQIKKEGFANIVLIGNETNILNKAKESSIDLLGVKIENPLESEKTNELVDAFYELRKHKGITEEEAREIITSNYLYFGCMYVKNNYADGLVAGAINSSSNVLRAALQTVKTAPDSKFVSSFFLMDVPNCDYGSEGVFVYSDCGMIQEPTKEQLVEIAKDASESFEKLVGEQAYVAMLSHSTYKSSECTDVYKVIEATEILKNKYPQINVDGELQVDAAIVPSVAKSKAPSSSVAGKANVLIFPDLDAGNIAYKLTERLAKAKAYGPITQGIAKPINDLSRGCNAEDIVGVVAITAVQSI